MEEGLRKNIKEVVRAIGKAQTILIVSHVNPDGDAIGSQLGLGLALLHAGKKIILACEDPVPVHLQFLPGSELVTPNVSEEADLSIAVDCGSANRMGSIRRTFFKAKNTVQIDHHDFGEPFGKIQVLEEEASAVGEIIYEIVRALKLEITQPIASCLMTSIIIDTGSFRFSNLRSKTFDICGKLIRCGVDLRHLIEEAYWKKSRPMARLLGHCFLNADFSEDGSVAWIEVSQKLIQRLGAKLSDADSVADDLRAIEGVKAAVVFRQVGNGEYRVSLRSKHGMNVAIVAKMFGGGGHHNSAGCTLKHYEKDRSKLLKAVAELTVR